MVFMVTMERDLVMALDIFLPTGVSGAGLLLLRDDKDFQSWDSGTQTMRGPYTADIRSLYSEYTGRADWRMPDLGGKS